MADNPYTKPTLSDYNANPPSDDGSQTAANEVAWSNNTDKIGDPLKNFSNAQNNNTSDAFAKTINKDADQKNSMAGSLAFTSSELTIVAGVVAAVRSHHTIDTESDDATDNLNTVTVAGVDDGALLILRSVNASRVVTLQHNVGNIQLKDGLNLVLDVNFPSFFQRIGTDWFEIQRPDSVIENTGTWIPTIAGDATGVLAGGEIGQFTKHGRIVQCQVQFDVTTTFTASVIGGLPFTPRIESTLSPSYGAHPVLCPTNNIFLVLGDSAPEIQFLVGTDLTTIYAPSSAGNGIHRVSFTYETDE